MGFDNSHTKFGVLLTKHMWVMIVSNMGADFSSDLDVGAYIV